LKAFGRAIPLGVACAVITWVVAFTVLREPNPRTMPDGSFVWVTDHGSDEQITALLWAAGAYVLTFTPALLFTQRRIPKNVFEKKNVP